MKSTKTKFEKVSLTELKKILPEAALNGAGKRKTDLSNKVGKPGKGKSRG